MAKKVMSPALRALLQRSLGCPFHELNVMEVARGRVNSTFHVMHNGKVYFARDGNPERHKIGVKWQNEVINTKIAHRLGIGPRVVGFDIGNNCLITEGLPGDHPDEQSGRIEEHLTRVVRTLKRMQNGPEFVGEFRPLDLIEAKYVELGAAGVEFSPQLSRLVANLGMIRQHTVQNEKNQCPCHGDLAFPNVLEWQGRIFLIDFECAGMSGFLYDIGKYVRNMQLDREALSRIVEGLVAGAKEEMLREAEHVMLVSGIWMVIRLYIQISMGNDVENNQAHLESYSRRLFELVDKVNPSLLK